MLKMQTTTKLIKDLKLCIPAVLPIQNKDHVALSQYIMSSCLGRDKSLPFCYKISLAIANVSMEMTDKY